MGPYCKVVLEKFVHVFTATFTMRMHEWDSGLKVQWGSEIQHTDCSLCIFNWDRRQNTSEVNINVC